MPRGLFTYHVFCALIGHGWFTKMDVWAPAMLPITVLGDLIMTLPFPFLPRNPPTLGATGTQGKGRVPISAASSLDTVL